MHYWQVLSGRLRGCDFQNLSFDQLPSSGVAFWRRSASKAPTDFSPSSELEELLAHQDAAVNSINSDPWIQCCMQSNFTDNPKWNQLHGSGSMTVLSMGQVLQFLYLLNRLIALFCCIYLYLPSLSLSLAISAASCLTFSYIFANCFPSSSVPLFWSCHR